MIDTWEIPAPNRTRRRRGVVALCLVLGVAAVGSVWAYGYRYWGAPAVPNIVYLQGWQYEYSDGMDGEPPPHCSSPQELQAQGQWPGVPVGDIGRTHKDYLDVSWTATITVTPRRGAGSVLGVDPHPVGPGFPYGGLLVPGGPGCYVYFRALT